MRTNIIGKEAYVAKLVARHEAVARAVHLGDELPGRRQREAAHRAGQVIDADTVVLVAYTLCLP